jgi:LacI family transcriptional regulator
LNSVDPPTLEPRVARVTIVDIARHVGVSKSTVSLVLAGSSLVHTETRRKVQQAIEELGYVYNRGAASLRSSQSSILGMVINDLANPFFTELAIGIERACQASDFIPFIANTGETIERQAQVIRSMREHGAAGLVICPAVGSDPGEIAALTEGLPVVFAMRRLEGGRGSAVVPDNRAGARAAVRHLISLGHRRIAFFGGVPGMVVGEERIAGYRDALQEAGIAFEPSRVVEGLPTRDGGRAFVRKSLKLKSPPTAALCFSDVVAIGAIHALRDSGRVVGEDFAIIGFDDIDEAKHMSPALTSVAVDGRGLGETAAHLLMRQIRSGYYSDEMQIGEARLIIRASCGALKSRSTK